MGQSPTPTWTVPVSCRVRLLSATCRCCLMRKRTWFSMWSVSVSVFLLIQSPNTAHVKTYEHFQSAVTQAFTKSRAPRSFRKSFLFMISHHNRCPPSRKKLFPKDSKFCLFTFPGHWIRLKKTKTNVTKQQECWKVQWEWMRILHTMSLKRIRRQNHQDIVRLTGSRTKVQGFCH